MWQFIQGLFSPNPGSMSSSRFMAFLLVIGNLFISIYLAIHQKQVPHDILILDEGSMLLIITVLIPGKVAEIIQSIRTQPKV